MMLVILVWFGVWLVVVWFDCKCFVCKYLVVIKGW